MIGVCIKVSLFFNLKLALQCSDKVPGGAQQRCFMLSLNWNRPGSFVQVAITRPILQGFRHLIERSCALTTVIVLLFMAPQAGAGEIEPRAYVNTPVGINFLLGGYVYKISL
jgi:hypothetical protein